MPTPPLITPRLDKYDFLNNSTTPHTGKLCGFAISRDGHWILSSSEGPKRNVLALISTAGLTPQVHGVVELGQLYVTALVWGVAHSFFIGCNNGAIYSGRIKEGENFVALSPISEPVSLIESLDTRPVISIAFDHAMGVLAYAIHNEVVMSRNNSVASPLKPWQPYHRLVAFPDLETPITCLAPFGKKKRSLFIGSKAGFIVVSMHRDIPQLILANHEYQIATCVVSPDNWTLAASTFDNTLVVWTLRDSGLLIHSATVIGLPLSLHNHMSAPQFGAPLSITRSGAVITGTSRYLHFLSAVTREKCGRLDYGAKHRIQSMMTHGRRIYLVTIVEGESELALLTYSSDGVDINAMGESEEINEGTNQPYIKQFNELAHPAIDGMMASNTKISPFIPTYRWFDAIRLLVVLAAIVRIGRAVYSCSDLIADGISDLGICLSNFFVTTYVIDLCTVWHNLRLICLG